MEKLQNLFQLILTKLEANLPPVLFAFVFLLIGFFVANKLKLLIRKRIVIGSEKALTKIFISQFASVLLKIICIVIALQIIGFTDLTTKVLAGAGILTFVVGFAFKDIGENFLAGILLAFKSPFKINDLIETEGIKGYVVELTIRETRIKTVDGKDVFIPNGKIINNPLFNYTIDGFLRYDFVIGLDYGSNVHNAIISILNTVKKVEGVIIADKPPVVTIDEFAASTINLRVLFWINTFESTSKLYHSGIKTEVMQRVLENLTKQGFSLPSDIIEIKQYKS